MIEETIDRIYFRKEKYYSGVFDFICDSLFSRIHGLILMLFGKHVEENQLGSAGSGLCTKKMVEIFAKNITVYIDLIKKVFVFSTRGKDILLPFDKIKEIVLVRHYELGFYNRLAIDVYDEDYNAYECYETGDYEDIQKTAKVIENVYPFIVLDKMVETNYDGFRRRII